MTDDDRAERALREALGSAEDLPAPDLGNVRRRVRRRRVATGALTLALAVIVGTVGISLAGSAGPGPIVAAPSRPTNTDPAPDGWRTEYYRNVSFQVPDTWGYAYEPGSDWCVAAPDGRPDQQHQTPYVALGRPEIVASVACPDRPASLTTEHVAIHDIPPNVRYDIAAEPQRDGDWWSYLTLVGNEVLTVTSRDRATTVQIIESAQGDAPGPCAPIGPAVGTDQPAPGWSVTAAEPGSPVVVCQYEATGSDRTGLRAVAPLDPEQSQRALDAIRAAPVMRPQPCETPVGRDLVLVVRVQSGGAWHDIHVQAGTCADGSTPSGGFNDGSDVRVLTRDSCHAVLLPPASLSGAGRYVGEACLG